MNETDSLPAAEKPPKLRWYQWRLRSMFILTLLVAIGMSWLTVEMRNERRQKAAADEIVKARGTVESEPTWLGKLLRDDSLVRVTDVNFRDSATDAVLVNLRELSQLQTLRFEHGQIAADRFSYLHGSSQRQVLLPPMSRVTDAGLVNLRGLSQLKGLDFIGTEVTDAGMVYLQGLTQLQSLFLAGTKVSGAGLVHLEGLSQLHWLTLTGTQVTDAGLLHLRGLRQLTWLDLGSTKVTDAGLVHLEGLTQLQALDLSGTKVTDQGVKRLQQALPKCKIQR